MKEEGKRRRREGKEGRDDEGKMERIKEETEKVENVPA
jgi:hypothetical protein